MTLAKPRRQNKRAPDRKPKDERPPIIDPSRLRVGDPFNPYKIFYGIFLPDGLVGYDNDKLSWGAKILWGKLAKFAGQDGDCYPSQDTLAKQMGSVSVRTIRDYSTALVRERFIRAIQKGLNQSNHYHFLWHECLKSSLRLENLDRKNSAGPDRKTMAGLDRKRTADKRESQERITERETSSKETCAFVASSGNAPIQQKEAVGQDFSSVSENGAAGGKVKWPKFCSTTLHATYKWMDESGGARIGWPPIALAEPKGTDSPRAVSASRPLREAFSAACKTQKRPYNPNCGSERLARWIEEDGIERCIVVAEFAAKRWELLKNEIPKLRGKPRSLYMTYCFRKLIARHVKKNPNRSIDSRWKEGTSTEVTASWVL